jgi:hypothetical protein
MNYQDNLDRSNKQDVLLKETVGDLDMAKVLLLLES